VSKVVVITRNWRCLSAWAWDQGLNPDRDCLHVASFYDLHRTRGHRDGRYVLLGAGELPAGYESMVADLQARGFLPYDGSALDGDEEDW
jgi:hypothetical protein